MSKYTFEEKLEAVLRVVNADLSIHESAHILGCDHTDVLKWTKLYQEHGAEALTNGGARYDGEFKIMVVEYMHANHLSCRETAAIFGIKFHGSISKWERIYYEEGPESLLIEKRGRPPKMSKKSKTTKDYSNETKEDLIAEVERLQMENEYLKKLNALVQERIARENGKEPPSSTN